MEPSPTNSSSSSSPSSSSVNNSNNNINTSDVTWRGMNLPFRLRTPLSLMLEYSGIMSSNRENSAPVAGASSPQLRPRSHVHSGSGSGSGGSACSVTGEVEIRVIGAGEQDNNGVLLSPGASSSSSSVSPPNRVPELGTVDCDGTTSANRSETLRVDLADPEIRRIVREEPLGEVPMSEVYESLSGGRYDLEQVCKWVEQLIPFSLLLLLVFIRLHFKGFFVSIFTSAVMFKSNEIVKKQAALKGDRKGFVLLGISFAFMLHVISIYWWCRDDDLLYPLAMLPPKETPSFWHAIFIALVNDTLVRQAAMALKCLLLIYYRSGRGHSFRRQGQILTLVEHTVLFYRALLPAPVWYRFFLNKDYGGLFSSLTTGLYLTFKLTNLVEKVRSFVSAFKALSKRVVQHGVYATKEQVNAAGDLCAICQEKMHAPICLRCKHIFCEECVSEWFERERTCPLCRAVVKHANLRSFGDGSTSLYYQFF